MLKIQNQRILLVVAHPDDELLGVGAAMHRLINRENCQVRLVILGEGITSRGSTRDTSRWEQELTIHKQNIDSASRCIGFQEVKVYNFPDNRFDTLALLDIIKVIEKEKQEFRPEVIFTHHGGDINIDHQRTFEAIITACRPMKDETVRTIITFETPSGTEWRASSDPRHFIPNLFIEVTKEDVLQKCKAMECYQYEKRAYPHPRSSKSLVILAQRWGIAMGINYAEAFQLIRNITIIT